MKKLLFSIALFFIPFFVLAQPRDSVTVFFENFDESGLKFSVNQPTGHNPWAKTTQLASSSPNSFFARPSSLARNKISAYSEAIPIQTLHNYIYLSFDHICKISQLDAAYIYIQTTNDPSDDDAWSSEKHITYTSGSIYFGSGTITQVADGTFTYNSFNQNSYGSAWTGTTPTNTWWRSELLNIKSILNDPSATHFRVVFTYYPLSGLDQNSPGWFLDNVRVVSSLTELFPPSIQLQAPVISNSQPNNIKDNIGPYTIKALLEDNDTISIPSVSFNYTVNGGPSIPLTGTVTSDRRVSGKHQVTMEWVIPQMCYGDNIVYYIYVEDTHGTPKDLTTTFSPFSSKPNITSNDAGIDKPLGFPYTLITGSQQPAAIQITNRSPNMMNKVVIGWKHTWNGNDTLKPDVTWNNGPMCMDYTDSLFLGNIYPGKGWNTVTAWVKSRNDSPDNGIVRNDTMIYHGYACDSNLRGSYVMGNSPLAHFKTLKDLKDNLFYCGLAGDVVVNILPGDYSGFTFLDTLYNGQSAAATITFQSSTGNPADVRIHDSTNNSAYGAITLRNAKHYRFNNLSLVGKRNSTYSRGVSFITLGSENIVISNCIIDIEYQTGNSEFYTGISRTAVTNPADKDISFINNTINGGCFGILFRGNSSNRHKISEISGNTINTSYRGIYSYYNRIPTISENTISQSSTSAVPFQGIFLDRTDSLNTIEKNKIFSDLNAQCGINLTSTLGSTAKSILICNNEINIKTATNTSHGIELKAGSNYINFVNNSIRIYSSDILTKTAAINFNTGLTGIRLVSNMLINECRSSSSANYPIYLENSIPTGFVANYNNYYSPDNLIGYVSIPRLNLTEWRAAFTSGGIDDNSISQLPPFINPATGLNLSLFEGFECSRDNDVLNDITDMARKELTYIGAYTTVVPDVNLAITELVSPSSDISCPLNTYPITVRIMNVGGNTITFSGANTASIRAIFSGTNPLDTLITINSGTLAPLNTMDVVIKPNYTILNNDTVSFTFIVQINGDTVRRNDTLHTHYIFELISLNNSLDLNDWDERFSNDPLAPAWKFEQIRGAGNWRVQQGTGTLPAIAPVYGTGRLFFNANAFATNTVSRAIMPTVSLVGAENPKLELWFAHDRQGSAGNRSGVVLKVSTDGGVTYTTIRHEDSSNANDTILLRYNTAYASAPGWKKYIYNLNAFDEEPCVIIAIDGYGYGSSGNNLNIDRVQLINVLTDDFAITDLYTLGEAPTQHQVVNKVNVRIANVGANPQTHFISLDVSGANTYQDTIRNIFLPYQGETLVSFTLPQFSNAGSNLISVKLEHDHNRTNNQASQTLITTPETVGYADSSTNILDIGGIAGTQLVNRYNVKEELIVKTIRFYPSNVLDAPGKKVIGFVSDLSGNIRTFSDTLTITPAMVGNWVDLNINQYALSNVSDCFFAGIRLIDAGNYIGTQVEAPIRDSAYYTLTGTTYQPQIDGRAMISAVVEKSITNELEITSFDSPVTNCDLGHESIKISIVNNGSQTIPAGTVFHCRINGIHFTSDTLHSELRRLQDTTFTFKTQYNFTNNAIGIDNSYSIVVWAEKNPADRLNQNDTISSTVVSRGKSIPPVVSTPVNVPYHLTTQLTASSPITPKAYSWFESTGFESWKLLHQGDTFTTPFIFVDTTYYVTVAPGSLSTTTVGTGTASYNHPFLFERNYARGKIIYKESDLGSTIAPISKISIEVANRATDPAGIPIKIYIKHTNLNSFIAGSYNWANEIADAQLVYDGNAFFESSGWFEIQFSDFFDYKGGNIMILTETNCGGTCGSNPTFRQTGGNGNMTQFTHSTTEITGSATFTNYANRLNMKFLFSDLECASEKTPIKINVTGRPQYDVETIDFLHPVSGCTLGEEHVEITIQNKLNNTIPANTIVAYGNFNGNIISHVIDEVINPYELKTIRFATPFDFSARTSTITWAYNVYTDMPGEAVVYRRNDTISGSFVANQTDWFPDVIDTVGEFTHPFTINLDGNHSICFFYDSPTATTPIANRVPSYTTAPLYDTLITYWVKALNISTSAPRCTTKLIEYNIRVVVPDHDVAVKQLNSPIDHQCNLMNANLNVKITNTKDSVIPAGTFSLRGDFAGGTNPTVSHTLNVPVNGQGTIDVPFTNSILLGSNTVNNIYNYKIYADPINPAMIVYRGNDTIKGTLKVPATPLAPPPINNTATFAQPYVVTPSASPLNYYYFYDQLTGGNLLGEGSSFTTPENYLPSNVYYYSGRITQSDFASSTQVGTGNTASPSAFNFTSPSGNSAGIVLYTAQEVGGYAGRIDTISLHVHQIAGDKVPVRFYLLNDSRTALPSGNYDWAALAASSDAKLIFDDETDFANSDGWFHIAIPGGFDYTGQSLLLLTTHDCNGGPCGNIGVSPTATFKSTTNINPYKVVVKTTAPVTSGAFQQFNLRFNTKFYINYTCESPRSPITLTTTVPARELALISIDNPITPNNNYGANESVQITIKNYGTTSASLFDVGYQLDGYPVVMETCSATVAPGATYVYTFSNTIDLSGIYFPVKFTSFISSGDGNLHNDTLDMVLQKENPCISKGIDASTHITNVTFAGINNGIVGNILNYVPQPGEGHYTDYTQSVAPAQVVQGQSYPFSITNSFTTSTGPALHKYIYIDFDGNNLFDDGHVYIRSNAVTNTSLANAISTGIIEVPANAKPGVTRMRVITATTNTGHPCTAYTQGETEDYAVQILVPFDTDLGISKIFHPSGTICPDPNGKIRINVINYGNNTALFTTTDTLVLKATVTGPTGTRNYSKTISTGSLASGAVTQMSIDNVDYSSVGTYDVQVTLSYVPDQYLTNNTASATGTVISTTYQNVPFTESFESLANGDISSSLWEVSSSASNFKWNIFQERTNNHPNSGPEHDHTIGIPSPGYPEGKFAAISSASVVPANAWTALTSACVDLHFSQAFPRRLSFWEHIFAQDPSATIKVYIQVGSGDNFTTLDSIINTTQSTIHEAWKQKVIAFNDYDEVAMIRFYVTGHNKIIDPAIDDVVVETGFPDLGVEKFVYPHHWSSDTCVNRADSIQIAVLVKNFGTTPVYEFDIIGISSVGPYIDSITEHVVRTLQPGESFIYTFTGLLGTPPIYDNCQFGARTVLNFDEDPSNDYARVITCLQNPIGIDDINADNSVLLGQNIPNPASTQTRIPFYIPKAGQVTFNIYSLEGQLLHSEAGQYDSGDNNFELNTNKLSNGIYFYTLYFNNIVLTKKMVIQR